MGTNRTLAIVIVAIVHVLLGYVIVTGLTYNVVTQAVDRLKIIDIAEPPPPPPEDPPPAAPEQVSKAPPPIVSPPPIVRVKVAPPPVLQTVQVAPPPVTCSVCSAATTIPRGQSWRRRRVP